MKQEVSWKVLALLLVVVFVGNGSTRPYCREGDTCWPTAGDWAALEKLLDPGAERHLEWFGQPSPRPSAVPEESDGDQPLYGAGVAGLRALYVRGGDGADCFDPDYTEFCNVSVRNNPLERWAPGAVAWPLSVDHIRELIYFANAHDLCIMAAGTGHDFLNRHSCPDGLFIRTSLMKSVVFDLDDSRGPGGVVRLGPGLTFNEIQTASAQHGRYVSSGWANTVGIIGWSLGGGHGPFANHAGLGVDNIVEATVVSANAEVLTVSGNQHRDLWLALRGGGGSTWGIVTDITVRAHVTPAEGVTQIRIDWLGTNCDIPQGGRPDLDGIVSNWLRWSLSLGTEWSGLVWVWPSAGSKVTCGMQWTVYLQYVYLGANSSSAVQDALANLTAPARPVLRVAETYASYSERLQVQPVEYIKPSPWLTPIPKIYAGGVPSVCVSRASAATDLGAVITKSIDQCGPPGGVCNLLQFYQCITGNIGAVQPSDVTIGPGLRTGLFHYIPGLVNRQELDDLFALGEGSYFSESAYNMNNYPQRYWGSHYDQLVETKRRYDPQERFGCRHCVTLSDYAQ
mmetsp:Transcript_1443/g.3877  ORF Transcript_1443/g.3877 Transcript_1443/m.3877 type:complete len:567 (+) Transcript_1443:192-1892(+)